MLQIQEEWLINEIKQINVEQTILLKQKAMVKRNNLGRPYVQMFKVSDKIKHTIKIVSREANKYKGTTKMIGAVFLIIKPEVWRVLM